MLGYSDGVEGDMSDRLTQLNSDALPRVVLEMFAHWCVWEQARPALVTVLQRTNLGESAAAIRDSADLLEVTQHVQAVNGGIRDLRAQADPLGTSAAEGAAFEFTRMIEALDETNLDAEAVAFFAARVCGWSGWAETDFRDPTRKATAEHEARDAQTLRLSQLIAGHGSADTQ